MGIIFYYLTYNHHPRKFALNPSRDIMENEKLRPQFRTCSQVDIDKMMKDYNAARRHRRATYIVSFQYSWKC